MDAVITKVNTKKAEKKGFVFIEEIAWCFCLKNGDDGIPFPLNGTIGCIILSTIHSTCQMRSHYSLKIPPLPDTTQKKGNSGSQIVRKEHYS